MTSTYALGTLDHLVRTIRVIVVLGLQEDMEASLMRVKERLEKETTAHLEARQKISQLEDRTSDLEHRINCEEGERLRLERLLSSGSLPDDAKVDMNTK